MRHSYSISFLDISLFPLNEEQSEQYRILRNKPDIGKWFSYKETISQAEQIVWFKKYLEDKNDIMFAICDSSGNFIGGNSIYDIRSGCAEYGRLIINPDHLGMGFGYKATYAAALIEKKDLGLMELNLEVYEDNIAAYKTYQKVGFLPTGVIYDSVGIRMITMKLDLNNL